MSGTKKSKSKEVTLSDHSDNEDSNKNEKISSKTSNLEGLPKETQEVEEGEIVDPVGNQAQEEDQS